nr:MAG TPA: helix-turn-helix domain protein [Caudoviricetes sp.]
MSLLERVQSLLQERGISIKQAERESGLSNATIRKWETQNPSLDSIIKLAKYLHVSVDYLALGKEPDQIKPSRFEVYCDGKQLNEIEADLVAMFRLIGEKEREISFDFVMGLYEKATGEKMSTYSTYTNTNEQQKSGSDEGENTAHETA